MFILIGADLVPTKSNTELFKRGDADALVGTKLLEVLNNATYRIFNLEIPFTNVEEPIAKQGPNLITPTDSVKGYKALGVDLLTISNNHIMDQGSSGLNSTVEVLNKEGINHVGAGENLAKASEPFVFSFAKKRIGIYACAEHEFSIAEERTPGANPFDPLCSLDHVEELKSHVDYVIVLYHGGKEHYRYPSPMLQKTCHRMVDKGADLVVCQHSHCIGCEEKYNTGTIVYGQGNFIFDDSDHECWKTSLLIKLDEEMEISYIPLVKFGPGVRLADEATSKEIMLSFLTRSKEIKDVDFIKHQYCLFADSLGDNYLNAFSGEKTTFLKVINRLSDGKYLKHYLKAAYTKKASTRLLNYIECEAHRELAIQYLKEKTHIEKE